MYKETEFLRVAHGLFDILPRGIALAVASKCLYFSPSMHLQPSAGL